MTTPTSHDTIAAADRARKIKLILFDVDGVLTDGGIFIFPSATPPQDPATAKHLAAKSNDGGFGFQSQNMVEAKGFNAHDGTGISLARVAGLQCGIITKRVSETVLLRARDLKLEHIYLGQAHKMQAVREIMQKTGFTLDEIAYVGDDVIDLPVMRECGLAVAVADARPEVIAAAHYVTPHNGGRGAGRDTVDFILRSKGILESTIERYIDERNPISSTEDIGQGNM
jgi:3-deoxy-D-manno-octulosonate 8-phosphate phosphatase (KDO 8-P phosphatase)